MLYDMGKNVLFLFFEEEKLVEYSTVMLKLCGKVILVWVLRESLHAILVICITYHPL